MREDTYNMKNITCLVLTWFLSLVQLKKHNRWMRDITRFLVREKSYSLLSG